MNTQEIESRLSERYPDAKIEVVDMTGTENHYQVLIASGSFSGVSRIQRHKEVMSVFDNELKSGEVHALTIKAITPEEMSQ